MGYELNTEAYKILIKIEVGIREFFIDIIKDKGIQDWFDSFLGKIQRESIKDISERLISSKNEGKIPLLEDQYVFKLNRALKDIKKEYKSKEFRHPFYYLDWNDMGNLMRMKSNTDLIDKAIGRPNRETVIQNLNSISLLRNDIAHSRFISELDYKILKGAFDQISGLIPNFKNFYQKQTSENSPDLLVNQLNNHIEPIQSEHLLNEKQINDILQTINYCINSFWLSSFNKDLIDLIILLKKKMEEYKSLRKIPGGLLEIEKWKRDNLEFLINIKELTDE